MACIGLESFAHTRLPSIMRALGSDDAPQRSLLTFSPLTDQVVLAGGASRLPGLTERLYALFPEEGPTRITASIDSDQVLARGSALHAQAVAALPEDSAERKHILSLPNAPPKEIAELKTPATTRALGLVLPAPSAAANGDAGDDVEKRVIDGTLFVPIVHAHTPLPARRVVELPVAAKASSVLLSFAEAKSEVRVDKIDPPALDSEDEDDEPLEPEEVRSARFRADSSRLVELALEVSGSNNVRVEVVLDKTGAVQITASQLGSEAKAVKASLPAPK